MEKTEQLEKKLNSIRRGVKWFGALGRLWIIFGGVCVGLGIILQIVIKSNPKELGEIGSLLNTLAAGTSQGGLISSGIGNIIYGYLFLLGRDAFAAIEGLIREIGEIV